MYRHYVLYVTSNSAIGYVQTLRTICNKQLTYRLCTDTMYYM